MKHIYVELAKVVKKLKQNDPQAFSRLYELTYQRLYFFCYSMLKNKEDAKDALQETYINIYSNIHSLDNEKLFIAWANKIAYNICLRMLNKKKPILLSSEVLDSISADESQTSPEEQMISALQKDYLLLAIDQLNPTLRTVILLKYFENLKISQIAEIMDCPAGTIKSRLNTAKKILGTMLKKERRHGLFVRFFKLFAIKEALTRSAKSASLEVHAADSVFDNIVSKTALPEDLSYTPQPAAQPLPGNSSNAVVGVVASVGCVISFMVIHLLLSPPSFISVTVHTPDTPYTREPVVITAEIDAPLNNIREVYAVFHETQHVSYGVLENNTARFSVASNGEYTLYAIDSNKNKVSISATVSCMDQDPPTLKDYHYTKADITLYVEDSLSGINYSSIYGETESGQQILPQHIDEGQGKLVLPYPTENFYLYVQDMAGNQSHYYIRKYIE